MNRSRLGRFLRTTLAAFAVLVGIFAGAAPANADIGYPTGPGRNDIDVTCMSGKLYITMGMSVDNTYFQGQYMVWRYHLTNSRGYVGTSGWSGSKLMPYSVYDSISRSTYIYPVTPHSQVALNAATNTTWGVKVQVGRWVPGYGYRYSGWLDPTMVTSTIPRYYRAPWAACTT